MSARTTLLGFAAAALLLLAPAVARAQDAPGDSLLNAFVRQMRDSTDRLYGSTAAPVDTTGLDSALAVGLQRGPHWHAGRGRRKTSFEWGPSLGFNRADGGQLGASATIGTRRLGDVSGRLQYTTGTQDLLGEGAWTGSWS